MTSDTKCSAFFADGDGRLLCRDGFPTHPACQLGAGKTLSAMPFCCREEWCGKTFEDNGGRPVHMSERSAR